MPELPSGFVLNKTPTLPPGFVLDSVKPPQVQQQVQPTGFMENVKSDFSRRTEELGKFIGRQESPIMQAPATLAVGVGESIGFVGDVVGEGISSAYKSLVPEEKQAEVQEAFKRFGETTVGRLGIKAFQEGDKAFSKFEKANPDAALAVKSMLNIFGGSIVSKSVTPPIKSVAGGIKVSSKEAIDIVSDVAHMMKPKVDPTDLNITKSIVTANYPKGVGIKGKHVKADKHITKVLDDANIAVRTIIDELDNIKIVDEFGIPTNKPPQTLREFGQGIDGSKHIMFKRYNDIATKAGEKGAMVNLKTLESELTSIINDLDGMPADVRKAAATTLEEFQEVSEISTLGTQTRIKFLNNKLGSQLSYESAPQVLIDNLVRNNLQKGLDTAISTIGDSKQYAEFKRTYGALRSIEEDVSKRAAQHASKSDVNFFDMTDVYTHANLATGLLTGSPSALIRGAAGAGIKARLRFLNNPENSIKRMFNQANTVMQKGKYKPKSKLLRNPTKVEKPDIDYNTPTYLRQGKDLKKFENIGETKPYRYDP